MATVRVTRPQAPETLDHLVLVVINAVQALGPRNGIPARPRRDSAPPTEGDGARGIARRRRGRGRRGRGGASKGRRRGERARHQVVRAARNGRGTGNAVNAMRTESHSLRRGRGWENLEFAHYKLKSSIVAFVVIIGADEKMALQTPIPIYKNIRLTSVSVMFVGVKGPQDRAKSANPIIQITGPSTVHTGARGGARERRRCARE